MAENEIVKDARGRATFLEKRGRRGRAIAGMGTAQGVAVTPGPAGKDGRDGKDGVAVAGPRGSDGRDGVEGRPGRDGAPGKDGKDGAEGRDGLDGTDGLPGPIGPTGPPGADGKPGPQGVPGKDGAAGASGAPGKDGTPGAKGSTGADGASGAVGDSPVKYARRVQTNAAGAFSVTFPTGAFAVGVKPVLELAIEGVAGFSYHVNTIGEPTHTGFAGRVSRQSTTPIQGTINGLNLFPDPGATWVHVTARNPV